MTPFSNNPCLIPSEWYPAVLKNISSRSTQHKAIFTKSKSIARPNYKSEISNPSTYSWTQMNSPPSQFALIKTFHSAFLAENNTTSLCKAAAISYRLSLRPPGRVAGFSGVLSMGCFVVAHKLLNYWWYFIVLQSSPSFMGSSIRFMYRHLIMQYDGAILITNGASGQLEYSLTWCLDDVTSDD